MKLSLIYLKLSFLFYWVFISAAKIGQFKL